MLFIFYTFSGTMICTVNYSFSYQVSMELTISMQYYEYWYNFQVKKKAFRLNSTMGRGGQVYKKYATCFVPTGFLSYYVLHLRTIRAKAAGNKKRCKKYDEHRNAVQYCC